MVEAWHGVVREGDFEAVNGIPIRQAIDWLIEERGLDLDPAVALREYLAAISAAYPSVEPANGAREVLDLAEAKGYRIAVVSSAPQAFVSSWLSLKGLDRQIPVVVGGDTVSRAQPSPEPYLRAIEITGVDPRQSIAVEDTPSGATAGLAAGLTTYGLIMAAGGDRPWPSGVKPLRAFSELATVLA
jgi:HAD superfamily hydrolase (TIGR01509 family)